MLQTAKFCLVFLIGFLVTAAPARADAIKIGGTVDASSCVPFGCSPGTTYQQVVGSFAPVPEPATLVPLGSGLAGLWVRSRRSTEM